MSNRESRRKRAQEFRDRRRGTALFGDVDEGVVFALRMALDSAKLRDEASRTHGLEVPSGGGAFLFLRRYELIALAELLGSPDVPVELMALREHFEKAELFDVKIGGQG